jgi:DNA ligase D-like protein (predicted ligase)
MKWYPAEDPDNQGRDTMSLQEDQVHPMLAVTGKPFSGDGWIFEPKFDGIRCLASIRRRKVILKNRRLSIITEAFPEIADAVLDAVTTDCILDGEIIIMKDGKPDISAIQRRIYRDSSLKARLLTQTNPAQYVVFDIIDLEGESLISYPLLERKRILAGILRQNNNVALTGYVQKSGELYFEAALRNGFEGVVAKQLDSLYIPGVRSTHWVKFRKSTGFDLVVGGYTRGRGKRSDTFGALLLGAYAPDGSFVYVGRAGSGFSREEAVIICTTLKRTDSPVFSNPPDEPEAHWTLPKLVVEVKALEVTRNNILRFPVFLRVRSDKNARECSLDQTAILGKR